MNPSQGGDLILGVFEHVEHACGGHAVWRQTGIFQPRADHQVDAAGAGSQGAIDPRLHQNAGNSGRGQALGHVAVAAADIENGAIQREAAVRPTMQRLRWRNQNGRSSSARQAALPCAE